MEKKELVSTSYQGEKTSNTEESSINVSSCAKKFFSVCTKGFAFLFALLCIAFTLSLIVVGSYYVNNCSCQPFIPIYLIVTGCLLCLLLIYARYQSHRRRQNTDFDYYVSDSEVTRTLFRYLKDLLSLFVFAWFIAGSVTVYQIYWKINFHNVTSECYCQPLLYKYTFWSITGFYILLASVFVTGLIAMFIKYLFSCCEDEDY